MNNISIFSEINDNYIQLFDFSEIDLKLQMPAEIIEIKSYGWATSVAGYSPLKIRLIFWDHNFLEAETRYWFYIKYGIWKRFFNFSELTVMTQGSFFLNTILDAEKDLFYSQIILEEEIQLKLQKIFLLEKNSNLVEILKLP